METNRKLFISGITGILAILSICLGLWGYTRLEAPHFFEHYREFAVTLEKDQNGQPNNHLVTFSMQYVTDVTDDRTVQMLIFPEAPDLAVSASNFHSEHFFYDPPNSGSAIGQPYGRFSLRDLYVTIDTAQSPQFEVLTLTTARVVYSNGDVQDIQFGRIDLMARSISNSLLDPWSSGGSSDGASYTELRIREDLELVRVTSPLLEVYSNVVQLKLNGADFHDIAGLKLEALNSLKVTTQFIPPEDPLMRYTTIQIRPQLVYRDASGQSRIEILQGPEHIPFYRQDYSFIKILRYLRAKGVL
jgi:hypothetical protein